MTIFNFFKKRNSYKELTTEQNKRRCSSGKTIIPTKWYKLNENLYIKLCCKRCLRLLQKEIKKETKYKIKGNKLMRYNDKEKKFKNVFILLPKKDI